jgi:hypothetical protein
MNSADVSLHPRDAGGGPIRNLVPCGLGGLLLGSVEELLQILAWLSGHLEFLCIP